ncbi:beta-lactamase-like domain-containing protein [Heterostelium album PN500]|uniref:Beta-lactamase-like domain-containing protein n=1 Tax=Heterostelium pallidum (strain ATCC 26659 / Pp 5 / PN500) TaxID=670386 RepID=D3B2D5_HETP5|nr:beta-lactamase-like domain-containing protein [Heterostelium album PN500]EFA84510.1 beta-lactamase-like domain-containing protein [Heterostelium album PN500]|eukprot:XP_020436623.1 beta-lactamase-like domain-containing protein [Heterostelium album PN500]
MSVASTTVNSLVNVGASVATNALGKTRAIFNNGRFVNPWFHMTNGEIFKSVLKWKFTLNPTKIEPLTEHEKQHVHPVLEVDLDRLRQPVDNSKLRCTWIGHSTFLMQFAGVNFLTDPVFADRCSPFSFAGPKRYRDIPVPLAKLPKVDFIVISHNHYDHLDISVVKEIGNSVRWFVPVGLKQWFKDAAGVDNVSELSWWEEDSFSERIQLVATPCHHNTGRGLHDRFKTLWCSWCIIDRTTGKKIYFGGDTAYCDVFKEIGHHIDGIDFSLLPIGAYAPRDPLKEMHVDPAEAVMIHQDIRSKRSIGCHWGTFILSDEPLLEPPRKLKEAAELNGLGADEFTAMKIGETRDFAL